LTPEGLSDGNEIASYSTRRQGGEKYNRSVVSYFIVEFSHIIHRRTVIEEQSLPVDLLMIVRFPEKHLQNCE